MSENNLIARNKFIAKLENKILKVNKSIQLLSKVDEKLFIKQKGGSGLYSLGINIADLGARANAWKNAMGNTQALQDKLSDLERSVGMYQNQIQQILTSLDYPGVSDMDLLDKFISMDDEAMRLAKGAYDLAYTAKGNRTDELNTAIGEFERKVRTDITVDDDKQTIIDGFNERIAEILTKTGPPAPPAGPVGPAAP